MWFVNFSLSGVSHYEVGFICVRLDPYGFSHVFCVASELNKTNANPDGYLRRLSDTEGPG